MPAFGVIKLADANVWLALAFSDHLHHCKAKAWFEAQAELSTAFCRITQMALLRHLTNPKIMGSFVQNQQNAWKAYDALIGDPRVVFLAEPVGLETSYRELTQSPFPSREAWTDAYLAAFAIKSNSHVITFESGFKRFFGLQFTVL
jgi:toxin-antitoxin system PIN domain toxin